MSDLTSAHNPAYKYLKQWKERPRSDSAAAPPVFTTAPNLPPLIVSRPLKKKARRKFISYQIASSLASLESPLKKAYLRTLGCCKEIRQEGQEVTSMYCGNRWCLVCCAIRTGKLFNQYTEILQGFNQAHFVTLTVRNIVADVETLKHYQKTMFKHHRKTQDMLRKYGIAIRGIRKYEPIVAKHDSKMLHPHFHWTIDGTITEDQICEIWFSQKLDADKLLELIDLYEKKKINLGYFKGEMIVQLWLKRHKGITDRKGQDVRPVKDGTEMELFKYETKMLVYTKAKKYHAPLRTLDKIYQATKGVRTIQITGFITRKPTPPVHKENGMVSMYVDKKTWIANSKKVVDFFLTDAEMLEKYPYPEIFERYNLKYLDYLTYKAFTETEEEDINSNLKAQIIPEAKAQSTVFAWCGDNWYCISTGQPFVKYQPGIWESGFIEAFDSS